MSAPLGDTLDYLDASNYLRLLRQPAVKTRRERERERYVAMVGVVRDCVFQTRYSSTSSRGSRKNERDDKPQTTTRHGSSYQLQHKMTVNGFNLFKLQYSKRPEFDRFESRSSAPKTEKINKCKSAPFFFSERSERAVDD